ncbi:hypothetical protein [Streptomyces sp. CC219B]|nr:hypothetical protein [Streptomyces sp. CC219B]
MPAVTLAFVLVVSALGSVIVPRITEPTPYYRTDSTAEGDTE